MTIFVGSTNPTKVNAVTIAASETWPDVVVKGLSVDSLVNPQPRTDQETAKGAENRARAVLSAGLASLTADPQETYLGVGLEGGVFDHQNGELWSTVWGVVVDQSGQIFSANGARFAIPEVFAAPIRAGGEMGPVIQTMLNQPDLKEKQGMIGVITNNFVDRTEEYANIAKLALGQWYGFPTLQPLLR